MTLPRKEVLSDGIEIWLGDCRDVLPLIGRVDAVVTDPPYGVNLGNHSGAKDNRPTVLTKAGYDGYDDTPENFAGIIAPAIKQALGLADRGAVFMAHHSAWMLPVPSAIGGIYLPSGMGRNPWGFASIQHCLFYGSAPDLNLGAHATAIYSTETADRNGHPCPKPIGWMNWLVSLASRIDETIIDPFMGSGTTGVACVNLGRKFIGIEREPKYFDIARRRITDALNQPRMNFDQPPQPKQVSMFAGAAE